MQREAYYGGVEMLDKITFCLFRLKNVCSKIKIIHANCKFDKTLVQFQPPPLSIL